MPLVPRRVLFSSNLSVAFFLRPSRWQVILFFFLLDRLRIAFESPKGPSFDIRLGSTADTEVIRDARTFPGYRWDMPMNPIVVGYSYPVAIRYRHIRKNTDRVQFFGKPPVVRPDIRQVARKNETRPI